MNLFQQILSVSNEFREHFEKETQQEERIKAVEEMMLDCETVVTKEAIDSLKDDLVELSDTMYVAPIWYPCGIYNSALAENKNASTWYIPMLKGATYHITMSNINNANRVRIFTTESLELGSAISLLETKDSVYFENLSYTYTNTDGHKYLWLQTNTASITTAELFEIKQINDSNDVRIGSKTVHRPNRESFNPIDSIYAGSGNTIVKLADTSGYFIACRKNRKYRITVSGNHNRFFVKGVSDIIIVDGGILSDIIWSSENTSLRSENETCVVNSDNYNFLYVAVRYNQAIKPILTVYEIEDNQYSIDGVKLFAIGENEFEMPSYEKFIYKSEYTSSDDVELVSTYSEVISLYDALVTKYPSFVSKNALNNETDGTVIYEYVFSKGDYNARTGLRNADNAYSKPKVLFSSGIHGYEQSAVMSTYAFCKDLCESYSLKRLVEQVEIHVVPVGCPNGYNNNSRLNSNNVNINRNFDADWKVTSPGDDYSGTSAGSEYETQALQKWMTDNNDAVLYIDHHNSGYTNEVSYFSTNENSNQEVASKLKKCFWNGILPIFSYWENVRRISTNNIYAYVGYSSVLGSSTRYGESANIPSVLIETSWNQYESGKDSAKTIGVGAEVVANTFLGLFDYINEVS